MESSGKSIVSRILVTAVFVVIPYVPTLFSGFDFNDDGCLAYPSLVHGLGGWVKQVAVRTRDEFHYRGPFRPVTWMHWTASAELFGDNPFAHRLVRFGWSYLAAALFLWLLVELGIGGWPAFFAAAVAFWSPFRNEYWMGLGLTEAFGTPYGFLGLIAAIRAARSTRPWGWDVLGWACALAAIGCKNTFAAVVPAMLLLRLSAGGLFPGSALRKHWPSVLFLGSVLIFPVAHLVALKLDPSPKEYHVAGITWHGFSLWPKALLAAFGFSYLLPALALLGVAYWQSRKPRGEVLRTPGVLWLPQAPGFGVPHPGACWVLIFAGILLIVAGVGVYLPTSPGVSGRYTVPAAWGFDLILALIFQMAFALPAGIWKRAGVAALVLGVAGMLAANVGKQTKWQGRADLFWQVVHVVESEVPNDSKIAWVGSRFPVGDEIGLSEGIHFNWHLEHRGRKTATLILVDEKDPHGLATATFACTGRPEPPPGHWQFVRTFKARYWLGMKSFACYLWNRRD